MVAESSDRVSQSAIAFLNHCSFGACPIAVLEQQQYRQRREQQPLQFWGTAIQFVGSLLPGGWAEVIAANRALAIAARETLCNALNLPLPCPTEMIGSLAVVPLSNGDWQKLHNALLKEYQIEVPVIPWGQPMSRQVRISAQIYNHPNQYAYLTAAIVELLEQEQSEATH